MSDPNSMPAFLHRFPSSTTVLLNTFELALVLHLFYPVPRRGWATEFLLTVNQALWLQQGYLLEFLGISTFFPGLYLASLSFFFANVWILGIIISDVSQFGSRETKPSATPGYLPERVSKESSAKGKSRVKGSNGSEGKDYANVLQDYMNDLNTVGVVGRECTQGMVLGEVEDSD